MNAYEKRQLEKKAKKREYNKKHSFLVRLERLNAERYYEEAFIELQGKKPMVIPKVPVNELKRAADVMWAKIHEMELSDGVSSSDR